MPESGASSSCLDVATKMAGAYPLPSRMQCCALLYDSVSDEKDSMVRWAHTCDRAFIPHVTEHDVLARGESFPFLLA